jgi:hypothetical protein
MTNPVSQLHPPGVWIDESSAPGPITGVSTSVVAMIGQVNLAATPPSTPTLVSSWADYVRQFSDDPSAPPKDAEPAKAKSQSAAKPAAKQPETPSTQTPGASGQSAAGPAGAETPRPTSPAVRDPFGDGNELPFAVRGFYENGGSVAYIVPVDNLDAQAIGDALTSLQAYGDVGLVCAPGVTDTTLQGLIVAHCKKMGDRFAILDGAGPVDEPPQKRSDGSENPKAPKEEEKKTKEQPAGAEGEPAGAAEEQAGTTGTDATSVAVGKAIDARLGLASDHAFGAVYWPWLVTADKPSSTSKKRTTAPSGHIAGVFARTDADRGVHKAPANEVVNGVSDVSVMLDDQNHMRLNNANINAIRIYPGRAPAVWGARTLSDETTWRFVNVRRLMNYIEKSIVEGTRWAVFEPNNLTLWKGLDRTITEFLSRVWRSGALFGSTADQAFYVKIDESINPSDLVNEGILTIEIGVAPVTPAEYIIIQIGQWDGGARISEI